jgi:hypothetical protein
VLPERANELREPNDKGAAVLLYLDVDDDTAERLWDTGHILALDSEASASLVALLDDLRRAQVHVIAGGRNHDEAARAIRLFLACGTERQAFLLDRIEALYNTLQTVGSDPLLDVALSQRRGWLEDKWAAELQRFADLKASQERYQRGELSADDVMREVNRLFGLES